METHSRTNFLLIEMTYLKSTQVKFVSPAFLGQPTSHLSLFIVPFSPMITFRILWLSKCLYVIT